jgi:hypothetical protein
MSVRSRLEAQARLDKKEETQVAIAADATTVAAAGVVEVTFPPVPTEIDPSMPGIPTVAAPTTSLAPVPEVVVPAVVPAAVEPIVAPAPVVPALELRHTWQPTDENDKPIGGLQVIVYHTEQEKFEKMQEKTVLLLRQLRKERREKALGTSEERVDDAEKFQNVVEFKPRDLSADERFKISQGIASPETFAEARDQLLESAFGVKPSVLASTLNDLNRAAIQQRAVENYIEFLQATGFHDSPENRALVTGWLGTRNLAPTVANFQIAQNRLKEAGLLQEAPAVRQEPVVVPTPAVVAPVEQEPKPQVPTTPTPALVSPESQAKRHSHVPSGLTASIASPAGTPSVGGISMTLADIDKMSGDEYKQRSRDPQFVKLVNQLEEDASKRRRARASQ